MKEFGTTLSSRELKKYRALINGLQCDGSSGETIEMMCQAPECPLQRFLVVVQLMWEEQFPPPELHLAPENGPACPQASAESVCIALQS